MNYVYFICFTWFEKSGGASGALKSGHPQDPKYVCITGAARFQECFS